MRSRTRLRHVSDRSAEGAVATQQICVSMPEGSSQAAAERPRTCVCHTDRNAQPVLLGS